MRGRRKFSRKTKIPFQDYTIHSTNTDLESLLEKESFYSLSIDPGESCIAYLIEETFPREELRSNTILLELFGVNARVEDNSTSFIPRILDEFTDPDLEAWWPSIGLVVIERQMANNPEIWRMTWIFLTYFLMKCPQAIILEVSSKLKGKVLGSQKGEDLGKWSVMTGEYILQERQDEYALKRLRMSEVEKKRKHDMTDTICQLYAFLKYILDKFSK